ncbi:putative thiol-dependent reductase 1 [Trypanosoma cruzi]|uniref:Thiol-dependent reductase 1, putative n=3 Tax=Trypanosoma cruzi TaxID=5693 RepID=Q4CZ29_TRYCC|nr:thiol-dependent reductase 1, putative [Trypanosoma cruzi]AAA21419.1 TcAc2 [Trypanosoma cruzi]ABK58599.1 thiol transferase Tc52 [Trypanosoma cruzi]EAN85529.1 thiol-dependent reductase 1, putative [Trypanosoma cruzi]KAF8291255.1 putative thiol-dependent reductase 1 [Trypanosoma cruzi]PWV17320.1 putative thiol-dependent reductase 1 [Trypanosoma cruzi]|eukprot:XP_807380.1 thiol-dependent reductase 1 [Trypanosoma cruzi strain CL Brener]
MKALKLFKDRLCPFCQRVLITAKEKRVTLEEVEVPLGDDMPQWYKELNPRETVPTLQVDGKKCMIESDLISRYIDRISSPANALMGSSPYQRHRVEFFLGEIGDLVKAYFGLVRDPFNEEKRKSVDNNTAYIEDIIAEHQGDGPYFLDDTFSMAEVMVVPFLACFRPVLSYYCGYDIFHNAPRLKKMYVTSMQRTTVKETISKPEEYIIGFKSKVPKSHVTWSLAPGYVLFVNKYSPFSDRPRLACALKNIDLPMLEIDLKQLPPWFRWFNQRETVPTLLTPQGTYVHESQLIVHYLDDGFPEHGPALLPKDADGSYHVRFVESNVDYFMDAMYSFIKDPKNMNAKEEFDWAAGELEKLLAEHQFGEGPFFGGATMNAADVSLVPMLVHLKACTPELTEGQDLLANYKLLAAAAEAGLTSEAGKKVFLSLSEYSSIYKTFLRPSS